MPRVPACPRNDNHKQLVAQIDVWAIAAKATPKIFCGIYTYHKNHHTKVKVSAMNRTVDRTQQFLVVGKTHGAEGARVTAVAPGLSIIYSRACDETGGLQ